MKIVLKEIEAILVNKVMQAIEHLSTQLEVNESQPSAQSKSHYLSDATQPSAKSLKNTLDKHSDLNSEN